MANTEIGPFSKVTFSANSALEITSDGDIVISTGDDFNPGEKFKLLRNGTINGKSIGGNPIEDTGWIAPSLLGGWANYGDSPNQKQATVGYRKIGNRVFIRGVVKNPSLSGLNNSNIFQLPPGFYPGRQVLCIANNVDKPCSVKVQSNGLVYAIGVDATWLGLDMVSFLID